MKLLTLNTHSLQEENYAQKLEQFTKTIIQERPDIIAMQEVNQSMDAPVAGKELLSGYFPCPGGKIAIREDNHAAQVAYRLGLAGLCCSWTWISAKIGYGKYDEGIALLCIGKDIKAAESFFISGCTDYENWKTRRTLGIQVRGHDDWFYTVHMGWWQDEEEPFASQWERLDSALQPKKELSPVWLLGDFNSPAEFRGQGYDCVRSNGWQDSYQLAIEKDSGITVEGCIDGWHAYSKSQAMPDGMRMDHIWCSRTVPVQSSRVLLNGMDGPKVSDHFGVLVTI